MITTGLALALVTGTGFYFLFRKLPYRVRKWMNNHPLFSDAVACLLTYILFGGTLVALFASAWLGIIVSIIFAITNNPTTNEALENTMKKINKVKDQLVDYIANYAKNNSTEEQPKELTETN